MRMELPPIAHLKELICAENYNYNHNKGVLDLCLYDLTNQRIVNSLLPEVHKLYSSWADTISSPMASDVESQNIAAHYGRIMVGL